MMRKASDTSPNDGPVSEHGYTVIFNQLADDDWQVIVPAFPEIVTHGQDLAEARLMARDAIRLVLEGAPAIAASRSRLNQSPLPNE